MKFVNLHGHSHYSLLDGFGSPEAIIKRAKELGSPAIALTDHGVVHGLVEFYKAGKSEGVKAILGCEFYVANRKHTDKEANVDVRPYHLTVLARNNEGYENILKLVSIAHLRGFYYKPRVDYDLLKEHSKGLIVLSGCMVSHLSRAILAEDEEEVKKVVEKHIDIFGKDSYFLEMQHNPLLEQQAFINEKLKKLSKEYDLKMVATNDSHYPKPEDRDVHDVMICIQTGKNVSDQNRMRYTGDYSIKSTEQMLEFFSDTPAAIENTEKIADMCNVDFTFGVNLIPSFDCPPNKSAKEYLRELCYIGLKKRFSGHDPSTNYIERLEYELKTVNSMGFDTYFLIVADFVDYAKKRGIVVGPGRGSAAGSIIAWCLGITDLDPLKYGLFFERFLNPERVSMPDIDIDFADTRRDEVLEYVVQKYGRENVAQIITFGTMAPRAAVRDVGRALGYPYAEVDVISKSVPPPVLGKHIPLDVSTKEDPALSKIYETDSRAKKLLDLAIRLEGSVRHSGTHACAVIISEKPLTHYTALQYGSGGRGEIVTQFSAEPLEKLGLLKMDFLGLRNLTVIENTQKILKERKGIEIDVENLKLDDEKTFELFQKGDTTGVFQFESPGMKRYLRQLKPTRFEDIVAMGALYRPGPMDWIPTYIEGKHDPDSVKYLHDSFKEILEDTYGVAVYQEQILQLARDFAGFSLGEADILRKAVGKKIPALLEEQKIKFVEGAVKNGYDKKFATEVFVKVVEPFAGYGFNKAHAVCYGLIAYRTAFLKANYPTEFMNSLLCSDAANTERVVLEIKECSQMGIDVLPPSVNESSNNFTVVGDKSIRFGLLAIKGVGEGPIEEIIKERDKNGEFKSIEDFARRLPSKIVNKKIVQALAYSGSFDVFGVERHQIAENYESMSSFSKNSKKEMNSSQTDIFGMMDTDDLEFSKLKLQKVPKLSRLQLLKQEKTMLGMYVSNHPLQGLSDYIKRKTSLISDLTAERIDKEIKITGLVSEFRKIITKRGGELVLFVVEDTTAKLRAIIFPQSLRGMNIENLAEDAIVRIQGKLSHRRDEFQIICNKVKVISLRAMIENAKESHLYDPEEKFQVAVPYLDDLLADELDESNGEESNSDSNSDKVYNIKVPKNTNSKVLSELKEFLVKNKGDAKVDVFLESVNKTIRLPFLVKVDKSLEKSIDKILKK